MCMCSAGDGGGGDNAGGGDFLCPALCCLKIYDKYCDLLLVSHAHFGKHMSLVF